MPEPDLMKLYAPLLRELSNLVGRLPLTAEEEERVRDVILELKAIYDRAANRES